MKTPREVFETGTHAKIHAATVASPAFRAALDAALLEFVRTHAVDTTDPAVAISRFHRLAGARAILELLGTLHERPVPASKADTKALDYKA